MARNPFVALVMGIIPIVNLYLIYQWWTELKAAKKSDKDPILWTILSLVPIVNIYAMYSMLDTAEKAAQAAKKPAYVAGVIPLLVAGFVLSFFFVGVFVFLYMIYRTQEIFNECGI